MHEAAILGERQDEFILSETRERREREGEGGESKARKEKLYNESESTPKTEREGGQCLHRCNNLF